MKLKTTLLIAAALLLQSSVFSQTNPLLRYIPDDVTMVFNIDAKKLGSKIPAETFRQSFFYRQMMKEPDSPGMSFFTQPEQSGIDLSAGIMIAIKEGSGSRYSNQPTLYIFIKLKNAELFTARIKELMKNEDEENEDGKIEVYGTDRIIAADGKFSVGWNNDVFVMTTGGYSEELMAEMYGDYMISDSTIAVTDLTMDTATAMVDTIMALPPPPDTTVIGTEDDYSKKYAELMEKFKKSQRELCFQLLTPKSNSALLTNTYFRDIMNAEADMKFWNGGNGNPLADKMLPYAEIINQLQPFLSKNKTALINFEKGKIVMKARNFPEPVIADIYKKYPPTEQNMDLVRRLPEGTLLGLLNVSMNQDMVNEMISKTGLLDLLAPLKKDIPFDLSLFPGTFKSNMMIAVLKSNMTPTMDEQTSKMGGFQLIAAFPIADKAKFEKLKAAIMPLWDSLRLSKPEMFEKSIPFAKHNDEMLVISLSPETATAFLNNTGTGPIPAWLQVYSKHPLVLNVNIRDILTKTMNDRPERRMAETERKIMNAFGNLIVYGGEYENETINSTMEFTFANPEENSLKQLFDMIATSMERMDDENDMYDQAEPMDSDTTSITPVSITVPTFKNAEVQQYANEYAEFTLSYINLFKADNFGDTAKLSRLSKMAESWGTRAQKIGEILANDPEEAEKFSNWTTALSEQITSSVKLQEVTVQDIVEEKKVIEPPPPPPPKTPPPKVEMKKYTPPRIKKDN